MSLILKVPTLNDDIQDFDRLFSLHQQAINSDKEHLILDFSDCQFLRHNAVAFLGGLVRFNQFQGKNVIISWHSIRERVCTNLKQNGFYTAHTEDSNGWSGNSIPYREERVLDKNGFLAYLRKLWLGRGWINVDEDIQREILSKVVEIYVNVFEHADSKVGVFVCGQHYPKRRELSLSLVDFGVGIPHKVRTHLNQQSMAAELAIEWAIAPGNSTRTNLVPKGIGLDALMDFVTDTRGKLEIFSDNGYILFNGNGLAYGKCSTPFMGTLVNISLKCSDSQYHTHRLESSTTLF
jgi:hypothetical protein